MNYWHKTKFANLGIELLLVVRSIRKSAESLDLPAYALKRLLNHKMNNDVTAGYIMRDVERLRKPLQLISDFLQKQMRVESALKIESEQVVDSCL